jgi:hypothetical protein
LAFGNHAAASPDHWFRHLGRGVDHSQAQADGGFSNRELQLKLWQWPAIEAPDQVNAYPASSAGAEWFPEAQRLYRELEAMAA